MLKKKKTAPKKTRKMNRRKAGVSGQKKLKTDRRKMSRKQRKKKREELEKLKREKDASDALIEVPGPAIIKTEKGMVIWGRGFANYYESTKDCVEEVV